MTWPTVIPKGQLQNQGSDETMSALQKLRASMLLAYAEGAYLTVIGQNYGVPRAPQMGPNDDELYRRIVPTLALRPKMIMATAVRLLEAILGTQAAIEDTGHRAWQIYEVIANEIIFEIPANLIATSNENASYLHGASGYAFNTSGSTSNVFTTPGNVNDSSATSLNGSLLYYLSSGSWLSASIVSVTYDAVTNTSTVTLGTNVIPSGGTLFFINVAGDGTQSYRGDYMGVSAIIAGFSTSVGVSTTTTMMMVGDYTRDLFDDGEVTLFYNGAAHTNTLNGDPTYDPITNVTAVILNTAIPQSLVGILTRELEDSDEDGVVSPSPADRVYLSGFGLYDVFRYYYDLLVRAAGIVVRLEIVSDYT